MEEHENPWKVISAKEVYDNKWINVTESIVIHPGGEKGIYGKVHFKNRAIGMLVLDNNYDTYLVGQYRFTLNEYSWEIPGGGGAMDSDTLESAKRELLEETGLVANNWTPLLRLHLSNSVTDELSFIFLAQDLEQHEPIPEETEQLVIKKIPFEEAWQMVEKGLITDAISVAAILKVKGMLVSGQLT